MGNLGTKQITNADGTKYTAWDIANVTRTDKMFEQAGREATKWNIGDISSWNTSNVENMEGMFLNLATKVTGDTEFSLGDLSKWDTSKVKNMKNMFNWTAGNAKWSLDLSNWQVPLVTSYENFNSGVSSKVIAPKFN